MSRQQFHIRPRGWRKTLPVCFWLALFCIPGAAAAQDGTHGACDPEIRQGLMESAAAGVEGDLEVIRDPDRGIRNPDSILDFSCLDDMFDFGGFDLFYDPGAGMNDLLGLLERQVCRVARDVYRGYLGRGLDTGGLGWEARRVPGVDVEYRDSLLPRRRAREEGLDVNLENFRNSLGGE